MNFLTILTLSLTISVSLSKPSHHDGSFTVDMIHIDSPQSPLYNPNYSPTDRLQNAFLRSMSRPFPLSKRNVSTSKIDADVFSEATGDFLMKLQIGTPPVNIYGRVSLVSDLVWVQCEPCENCREQVGFPFLVPTSSSTYKTQPCRSKACQIYQDTKLPCDTQNICHYHYAYEDGFHTKGVLSKDTFWFGPTPVKQVLFGCSHDNKPFANASGIIGLGGESLSLITQLKPVIHGKFSYCLISNIYNGSNRTSKMHFGDRAIVSGPNVFSTPIIVKEHLETYYHITLIGVLVGNEESSYNQSSIGKLDDDEIGNMIVDFESALTFIPEDIHSNFAYIITRVIDGKRVDSPLGYDQICYKDLNVSSVPTVILRFDGGGIEVSPVNLFMEVQEGVSCMILVSTEDMGMLGSLVQRNLMVGFDLVKRKLYFKPTDCNME